MEHFIIVDFFHHVFHKIPVQLPPILAWAALNLLVCITIFLSPKCILATIAEQKQVSELKRACISNHFETRIAMPMELRFSI